MNKDLMNAIKEEYGLLTDREVLDFIINNPNLFTSQTEDSTDYSDGYAPITTPNYSDYELMKKEKETFDSRPSRSPIGVKSGLGYNYFDPIIYEKETDETPKWKEYYRNEIKNEEPNNKSSKRVNPLLTLGLLDTVGAGWTDEGNKIAGDNTILNMYNTNLQNERNRATQYEYNRLLKEMDKADKEREDRLIKAKEQKATDEKNLETFLGTLNSYNTGKSLTDTEKEILKVQFERLNENDRSKYQTVYNKLGGDNNTDEINNVDDPSPSTFGTSEQQSKHKTYVNTEKSRIDAMPNGKDKQKAMEDLNAYITKYGKSVENGLGSQYTTKQSKAAGQVVNIDDFIKKVKYTALSNEKKIERVLKKAKEYGINNYTEADAKRALDIK